MISVIVLATGPERLRDHALDLARGQIGVDAELIVVRDTAAPPGAARNEAVRRTSRPFFLIVDGGTLLAADYAAAAVQALDATPAAGFAASAGAAPLGVRLAAVDTGPRIDAAALVGGPWTIGPAVIRREAYDRAGGFDESLPGLADWELLLAIVAAGPAGVRVPGSATRNVDDDVRLREALHPARHLPAMRRIVTKHQALFEAHMRPALVERERLIKALVDDEQAVLARRRQLTADLEATVSRLDATRVELARHGRRTLEFADLRRTTPVSRNWGGDRGLPVDRHYIHAFLRDHAADVRGHVLEMLDARLTEAFGGDRVERSDVLDIDPGNARATVIADLRAADRLPAETYDCFILTQTLHLIDDMPAAIGAAHRALKPGGVLLATLPCASPVALEYGSRGDHWRVTEAGARAVFERHFRAADLEIRPRGNVLTTTAFLHGLACDDLAPDELAVDDPVCPLLITVRARKPPPPAPVRRGARPAAAVLLYHRVAEPAHDIHELAISPRAFRSHLDALLGSWRILPLQTLAEATTAGDPPDRAVALTFDDGYLDNLDVVVPVLAELGVPATFFLTTEPRSGPRRFWWDVLEEALLCVDGTPSSIAIAVGAERRIFQTDTAAARRAAHHALYAMLKVSAPVVRNDVVAQIARQVPVALSSTVQRPMLADEVRCLAACTLIEIGAHSVHHPSLAEVTAEECHREVFESRSALERLTRRPVTSFAYPYGDTGPAAVEAVMAAGFTAAVTRDIRGLRAREHPLRIPRIPACEPTGAGLVARLSGMADA